ncbi:DNA alkylation repair protein [bacterium]|nr:DNA alkylation repair protein [bacterium]
MAKKLKDYYGAETAALLAEKLIQAQPGFDASAFQAYVLERIGPVEFLARQDIYADAFERFLLGSYTEHLGVFTEILGPELQTTEGMFTEGWWLWPVGRYIERHGLLDYEATFDFLPEFTKRHTAEFAVRPLLIARPEETLSRMHAHSQDPNVHVRRWSSEGVRIALPWAKKQTVVLDHFEAYSAILTQLRTAPEKFVQKSVGNNLNDLWKVAPDRLDELLKSWAEYPMSAHTQWIVKHGLRSERKSGS